MTAVRPSPPRETAAASPALRSAAFRYLVAAAGWAVGDVIELVFARTDTLADGASFVVSEVVFYAAMGVLVAALLGSRSAGMAGASKAGRAGFLVAAIAFLLVMAGGVLFNFAGFELAGLLLLLGGTARNVGEILAGVGVLRGRVVGRPGAFVFLIYALAATLSTVVTLVAGSAAGPGHVGELALAGCWALIGLTVLAPQRGRLWFILSLVAAGAALVSPFIPF